MTAYVSCCSHGNETSQLRGVVQTNFPIARLSLPLLAQQNLKPQLEITDMTTVALIVLC